MTTLPLTVESRFTDQLPADPNTENVRRQTKNAVFSWVAPKATSAPKLIAFAQEMAEDLGLSTADCQTEDFARVFTGNALLDGMQPYATCYGGHQFGNWAGQLGDGRAINLGEVVDRTGQRQVLQLKGAGETPYSRTADGLAVLRSSVREFLCSEAMHHLGVPTTRALSLCGTGDDVLRDMFYDGNAAMEPGAVVCRVAPSFTRFGHFEMPAARQELELLKQLADFTIQQDFSELPNAASPNKDTYAQWFDTVCKRTADMVVHWMRVGFVHGVMNTDNMSILGLTIDYGPYGWIDDYNLEWTPNTTDQGGRYAFGRQAPIAQWNLLRLANAIYPLLDEAAPLENALREFETYYTAQYNQMRRAKLGLTEATSSADALLDVLDDLLSMQEIDMTLFFRALATLDSADPFATIASTFYDEPKQETREAFTHWLSDYLNVRGNDPSIVEGMNRVNPLYVLRNYLAQQAIDLAEQGDDSEIWSLLDMARTPYTANPQLDKYAQKRPDWARTRAGCSQLSCSS